MGQGGSMAEALEALRQQVVDEAVAPLALPAELEAAVRACLEDELLLDPDARLLLRRALGDPELDHSGEVDSLDDDAPREGSESQEDDQEEAQEETG